MLSNHPLKASAALANLIRIPVDAAKLAAQPQVSILIALFRETEMVDQLIGQIRRLTYPASQLEAFLLTEQSDTESHAALTLCDLPDNVTLLKLRPGPITTKPRALNYGLRFCSSDIVGIYDAEDRPDPDQIEQAVAKFAASPSDMVGLQGVLNTYKSDANWLTRCLTIEYAVWFLLILPGIVNLGMAIPLGGTTVFLLRAALNEMGGWDAHNVTEDADLGIRIARHGYHTDMLPSVTYEEANIHV